MAFNLEIVKKHPVAFGGGAIALFLLLWYLMSKGGSSTSTATGATTGTTQADLQLAQIQAAQNAAQMQVQGQQNIASIQAGVQSQAVAASQAVQLAQTQAAQNVAESTNATQVQLAQVQGQTQTDYVNALSNIVTAQYAAQETQSNNVLAYLENQSNNQAAVAQAGIASQGYLDTQALQHVTQVGGSQNRTSIIESAMGNIPGSVTAEQGATASAVSGNMIPGQIAGAASSAIAALFA